MAIYLYKGLTRNQEIKNNPVWFLPNIGRLGQVRDTKIGTDVPYKMLQSVRGRAFAVSESLRENQQVE